MCVCSKPHSDYIINLFRNRLWQLDLPAHGMAYKFYETECSNGGGLMLVFCAEEFLAILFRKWLGVDIFMGANIALLKVILREQELSLPSKGKVWCSTQDQGMDRFPLFFHLTRHTCHSKTIFKLHCQTISPRSTVQGGPKSKNVSTRPLDMIRGVTTWQVKHLLALVENTAFFPNSVKRRSLPNGSGPSVCIRKTYTIRYMQRF
jgi:hypothetical protein